MACILHLARIMPISIDYQKFIDSINIGMYSAIA